MRNGEVPGREYLFVSREKMEADISAGKFIEHGEFRGHLYGTSADSVKTIINAGAVCIMNPHYQAIKALRTPHLKPYVIHIKPPLFDDLKITRRNGKAISSYDETSSRGFTVNNLIKWPCLTSQINLISSLGRWTSWNAKISGKNRVSLWTLLRWNNCQWRSRLSIWTTFRDSHSIRERIELGSSFLGSINCLSLITSFR